MNEFARPIPLDTIGSAAKPFTVTATPGECAALAARFGLEQIDRLEAAVTLTHDQAGYRATGTVDADIVQTCAATFVPVPASVTEPFTIRFVEDPTDGDADEIELDADDCDTMSVDGQSIDVGEAVAQTLALALDPFPRAAGADQILAEAGVVADDDFVTGPFAALRGLISKN